MSVEGDERVYRFNVAKSGTMKIRLAADYYSSYSDDILATLYRDSDDNDVEISNMNIISGSDYKNNDPYASIGYKTTAELSYKVTKGTYYLRLFWSNTGTLSMTATYPEGSSNDGKISCLSLNLKKGGTLQLGAVMAVDGNVTWTSSKTSVATVSSTGKVTAKGTGTAVITAKSGKNSVKIQIRVS